MISSDKNIETVSRIVSELKTYLGLQKEYVKLDATEKTVRLLAALVMAMILSALLFIMVIFLSVSLVFLLEPHVGAAGAVAIVALLYLLLFCLVCMFRHSWIEKPLVKILTSILMN